MDSARGAACRSISQRTQGIRGCSHARIRLCRHLRSSLRRSTRRLRPKYALWRISSAHKSPRSRRWNDICSDTSDSSRSRIPSSTMYSSSSKPQTRASRRRRSRQIYCAWHVRRDIAIVRLPFSYAIWIPMRISCCRHLPTAASHAIWMQSVRAPIILSQSFCAPPHRRHGAAGDTIPYSVRYARDFFLLWQSRQRRAVFPAAIGRKRSIDWKTTVWRSASAAKISGRRQRTGILSAVRSLRMRGRQIKMPCALPRRLPSMIFVGALQHRSHC